MTATFNRGGTIQRAVNPSGHHSVLHRPQLIEHGERIRLEREHLLVATVLLGVYRA